MNHYETLGIARDATPEAIKIAYRKLAKRWHPDRAGGDAARMAAIASAYAALSDPEQRAYYDAHGEVPPARDPELAKRESILCKFFEFVVDAPQPFEAMEQNLRDNIANARKTLRKEEERLARMRKNLGRIERPSNPESNLFEGTLRQQISAAERNIAGIQADLVTLQGVTELWAEYRRKPELMNNLQSQWTTNDSGTLFTTTYNPFTNTF